MRSCLLRPSVMLALLAGACSSSASRDDVPLPAAVVPNVGYATVPTAVEIGGSRFLAKVTQPSGGGTGTVDTHHRAWLGDVELQDVTWVSTATLTATVPPGLTLGPQKLIVENALGERGTLDAAFTVLAAPSFAATVTAPATVSVGQTFTVSLTVSNDGGTDVNGLTLGQPALSRSDLTSTPAGGPVPPAPPTLAAGAHQPFAWTYQATAPGTLAVTFSPTTGNDALLGGPLTATPPAPAQVTVQQPAAIEVTALSIPPSVAIGTDFTVSMTVSNTGGADASGVTPSGLTLSSVNGATATLKAGPTPAAARIPGGGGTTTFAWTYSATVGSFLLSGGAAGSDANSGAAITAGVKPSNSNNSTNAGNAAIIATIKTAPASVTVGQTFPVVVTFTNPGTANVILFGAAPTPAAASGPVPAAPSMLAAGQSVDQSVDLTWSFSFSTAGKVPIAFTAIGIDSSPPDVGGGLAVTGSATATVDVVAP